MATDDTTNDEDWKLQRDAYKHLGDAAFRSADYATSIEHYSSALALDPDSAPLLSNRSAAYLKANQKSKALYDAHKCVEIGFGVKGYSRLAAALQSLGRYEQALTHWSMVLAETPDNLAAQQGKAVCQREVDKLKVEEPEQQQQEERDELDDFFDEVEEVTSEVVKAKKEAAAAAAPAFIQHHKKDLGTADLQIERLLKENYQWRNLNPFYVLDLPHTASTDDIARRFKAMSLLLHPDKNQSHKESDRVQEAYDQVLKAKAALDNEVKAAHLRQLMEEGMKQGERAWDASDKSHTLEELQSKAVQKIFAQIEYRRREVDQRERNHEQREREQEEEEAKKGRDERVFDKSWKQDDRVEKRIGNWRDFHSSKKSKTG